MQFFDKDLVLLRLKSFGISAGSFLLVAVIGALASDDFRNLIATHAGSGLTGTLALLVFDGFIKHLRNVKISQEVGASASRKLLF